MEILRFRREEHRGQIVLDDAALEAVACTATQLPPDTAEIKDALDKCLEKLEGRPRQIFDLFHFRSLEVGGIARSLSLSRNAVFLALHRARPTLRRCMERRLGMEGGLR